MPATQMNQPAQGRHAVTATATPIAQLTKSSGSPTYTTRKVTDSVAWDLSKVENGHIVEVQDSVQGKEFLGVINNVSDAGDYVEVQGWISGGVSGRGTAAAKPTDGETAIIHKIDKCAKLLIDAHDDNNQDAYVGFDNTVTVDGGANPGHPLAASQTQPNHRLIVEGGLAELLDLKQVYVIGTPANELCWIAM